MQNTPAVQALINDVINIADKKGRFQTPSIADTENWSSAYRAYDDLWGQTAKKQQNAEIKKKKDIFRAEIKTVLNKIDNGYNITDDKDVQTYSMICQSEKLTDIDAVNLKKIIKNMPDDIAPMEKLLEQPQFGKFSDLYAVIKSKIIQLNDDETLTLLSKLQNNASMYAALSNKNPTERKLKDIEAVLEIANSDETNNLLPLFHLWKEDKKPKTGLLDSWDCLYDNASDSTDKRTFVRDVILNKVLNDSASIKAGMPHNIKQSEIDNFIQDVNNFHVAICAIDANILSTEEKPQITYWHFGLQEPFTYCGFLDKNGVIHPEPEKKDTIKIEDKLVSALEYVKIYPKIEALKKRQIEAKYPEETKKVMAFNEALDKEYKEAVNKHKQDNTFTEEVEMILKGQFIEKKEEFEKKLPPEYRRSLNAKYAVDACLHIAGGITVLGIASVAGAGVAAKSVPIITGTVREINASFGVWIKDLLHTQAILNNVKNAQKDGAIPTASTVPPVAPTNIPFPSKPSANDIQDEIDTIESPFDRLQKVIQDITVDDLKAVTNPKTLEALFNVTASMALNEKLDINERFKPFINLIEAMPDDKFKDIGFMNEERLSQITGLIKNAFDIHKPEFGHSVINKIKSQSDQCLKAIFDTATLIANDKNLDINERFKPFISIVETMPDDKFKDTGFMSEKRLLTVTALIKNAIELNRGDFAKQLIESFFPKLTKNQPEFMDSASETGTSIREEISEITEKATILSKKHYSESSVDKRKPLLSLMSLVNEGVILEIKGQDESEPQDIPTIGHLPEIVDNALNDLRKGESETTKKLLDLATKKFKSSETGEVLTSNEIFNGMDKKFLNLMSGKARVILTRNIQQVATGGVLIDQNPLNAMIANFLALYEGGHFAKGGGFSKECDDKDRYDVRMDSLPKIVEIINVQEKNKEKIRGLTIYQKLNGENETSDAGLDGARITDVQCAFKKVYDEANGNIDEMRKIFNDTNRFQPKPFEVKIKPEMSKQREAQKARLAALGSGASFGASASIGGV